jgi:hypothetical protein
MKFEDEARERRDCSADHMGTAACETRADHGDKLLCTSWRFLLHAVFHPFDFVAVYDATFGHLVSHPDEELVGGFASAFVRFFRPEDSFGNEGRDVV